ncbi:MAG: response regulator, partial [Candidatus Promineifilaceae bacterium]
MLPGEKATILVVDDNVNNLRVISQYLENEGFEIMVAHNGKDALEKAILGRPELILLDVMMPQMDGFETCRRLKADEGTQNIPILFMTALDHVNDILNGFAAGGVDYITKPFQVDEVMARINTHLTLYRLQRQQRELFRRFATREVANELLESGFALGGRYVEATAMFSDIRSFTTITES